MTELAWHTNAPSHWPSVQILKARPDDVATWTATAKIVVLGAFASAIRGGSTGLRMRLAATRLLERGVLSYPLEVIESDIRTPVFVYGEPSDFASAHFAGARAAAREAGLAEPVYYSREPIRDARAGNVVAPLSPREFVALSPQPTSGKFSMWWRAPGDEDFLESPCFPYFEDYFRALEGYHEVWLSAFARPTGVIKVPTSAALSKDWTFFLRGPEDVPVAVTSSRAKGVRFHLSEAVASVEYRTRFYACLARAAAQASKELKAAGIAASGDLNLSPLRGWEASLRPFALFGRSLSSVESFGSVVLNTGE